MSRQATDALANFHEIGRIDASFSRPEAPQNGASSMTVATRQGKLPMPFALWVDDRLPRQAMIRAAEEAGRMAKGLRRTDWEAPQPVRSDEIFQLLGTPVEREPGPESRVDLLATIHEKIIPQLVLTHGAEPSGVTLCADCRLPPNEEEVASFAEISVLQDLPTALAYVQSMAADGLSLEMILLHLVAPAARLLGAQWEVDARSFTEVTAGLCTLQQVVHVLGPSFAPDLAHRGFVVLVSPEVEQHTLGIYLLGEFLRRAGWGVQVAPSLSDSDLLELVESENVAMVGISVSNSDLVAHVTKLVAALKKASMNRNVIVMVGGSAELADYADQVGAKFCSDPRDAVRWLDENVEP